MDISGNLTRDIDLKFSSQGTAVANGSVAANKSQKNEQGGWDNLATLYQNFVAFGTEAETLAAAGRGAKVRLIGTLETQEWQDKQTGEKRSMNKLKVDFCRVFEPHSQQVPQQPQEAPQPPQQWGSGDVPF